MIGDDILQEPGTTVREKIAWLRQEARLMRRIAGGLAEGDYKQRTLAYVARLETLIEKMTRYNETIH